MTQSRWIGLAGPTASGKSAIALALAEHVPLEIISVDSALVYRGMDIGTAKPSAAERAAVPHHLIDLIDPREAYSAAQFAADATRLIDEIRGRGRLPLLVGGTMLYLKILSDGLDALPAADPALRAALEAEAFARGWPALHAELAHIDPASAARLPPTDAQRIGRALEVFRTSGRTLSSFHTAPRAVQPAALIALEPASRAWLHERIAARFDTMLAQGLLDEVRGLRARGDLHAGLPSMRCVGYRQAWTALDEGLVGEALRAAVHERGIAATRQLAKRQLTWLRGMQRQVVACDSANVLAKVTALIAQWRPQ
ncbi:MAG: tRNA (adenosine(37)-N6)-dimethylallyltransferase MiaA [Burkholderiaceae bacterium]|nr:tRNA (adenosine(37)-N6)-dimethylallyltransferase MiaA [Burkholderiaceae bacterium]